MAILMITRITINQQFISIDGRIDICTDRKPSGIEIEEMFFKELLC